MDLSSILNGIEAEQPKTSVLPKGKYNVAIEAVEPKETKSGGKALNFKLSVVGKKYNNFKLFDFINVQNASEAAQKIGLSRLKKISELTQSTDTTQMIGKKLTVSVGVETSEQYGDKNRVYGYEDFQMEDNTPMNNNSNINLTSNDVPF